MEGDTPQYYVRVTGGTVNGKSADWLTPGNNTFKPNAKASVTDTTWSGSTAAVVGNIKYHKQHVYTAKNKTVNITGPTTVTITASDYAETINQVDKYRYQSTSVTATLVSASAEKCEWYNGNLYRWNTDSWKYSTTVTYTYKKPDGSNYTFSKWVPSSWDKVENEPYWECIEEYKHGDSRSTFDWELIAVPSTVTTTQNGWVKIS